MFPSITIGARLRLTNNASLYKIISEPPVFYVFHRKLTRKASGIVASARVTCLRGESPPIFRKQRIMIHAVKTHESKNCARSTCMRKHSFGPRLEPLENRMVLHGGSVVAHQAALLRAAVASHKVTAQATSAETQVLSTISSTFSSYGTLQVQLDALAARLQHQKTSARKATAAHAQTLVKKFLKLENKRYKPIVALAPTVAGDAAASALVQFEQSLHQTVTTVKSQVLPQFRLLVGATFVAGGAKTRASLGAPASTPSTGGPVGHASAVRLADGLGTSAADSILLNFEILLGGLGGPLDNIKNAPDTSCASVASAQLKSFAHLLDVVEVFFEVLAPLASSDAVNAFVAGYNALIGDYNAAVTRNNQILASNQIITH